MSTRTQTYDLQQLTETVNRLSEALAASERRHSSMVRAVRWISLGIIVLVAGVGYAASDWINAFASQEPTLNQLKEKISNQPPPLFNEKNGILQSLATTKEMQGAIVKVLQSAAVIAIRETQSLNCKNSPQTPGKTSQCHSKTSVADLGEFFLDDEGNLLQEPGPDSSEQERMDYSKKLMESILMAAGQSIVDAAVLLHRVRHDSDVFRDAAERVGGVDMLVHGELFKLSHGMAAMVNEMRMMNEHMRVMGYSMGSTMGRMGSMMPW